jgi:hypothetical protein
MFSFEDCCFATKKSQETCSRMVMWREFNILNSYTLEVSFMGPNKGHSQGYHFNTSQLKLIGRQFCETLFDFVKDFTRVKEVHA